jgi:hypothetical protein
VSIEGLARLVKIVAELALVLGAGWWAVRHVGASALDAAALPVPALLGLAGRGLASSGSRSPRRSSR